MDDKRPSELRLPVANPAAPIEMRPQVPAAANATQHGLTAKKYLPAALDAIPLVDFQQQFREEYRPATTTERLLVDELARHAAMLEVAQEAERAVLCHGARQLVPLVIPAGTDAAEQDDAVLSAAVATDTLERLCRYRRAHERAFLAALTKLREIRALGDRVPPVRGKVCIEGIETEASCERELRRQFDAADWRCPRCGCSHGHWLARRRRWECANCHRQIGLRTGTVMENSPVPLTTWFAAIRYVLADPGIDAASLGRRIGIQRLSTVRGMIRNIQRAVASDGRGIPRALRDRSSRT